MYYHKRVVKFWGNALILQDVNSTERIGKIRIIQAALIGIIICYG
jgi:hypothetical protein